MAKHLCIRIPLDFHALMTRVWHVREHVTLNHTCILALVDAAASAMSDYPDRFDDDDRSALEFVRRQLRKKSK